MLEFDPEAFLINFKRTMGQAKYLGIFMYPKIMWKHHIMHVLNKCNKRISILCKVVKTSLGINHTTMRILYIPPIHSAVECGSMVRVYRAAAQRYLEKLDAIQHMCIHIKTPTYFHPYGGVLETEHAIVPLTL
jgi:hypothetical protein